MTKENPFREPIKEHEAPNKDQIKQNLNIKSAQLANELGFAEDVSISPEELQEYLRYHAAQIASALEQCYGKYLSPELAEDFDVQMAFLMNIQKMIEKNKIRKDGSRYYLHPQMAAFQLLKHPPENPQDRKMGLIGALLHDYIEEGEGISGHAITAFKQFLPNLASSDIEELIMLTEPNYQEDGKIENPDFDSYVDYDRLSEQTGYSRKDLETLCFGIMMRSSKLMQIVVPIDKLDNVGDCDQVQRKKILKKHKDPESEEFKKALEKALVKKIGTYLFYAHNSDMLAARASKKAMFDAVNAKINELIIEFPNLKEEVSKYVAQLIKLLEDSQLKDSLTAELADYYQKVGASDMVDKIKQI